jgi:ribonuclease HI
MLHVGFTILNQTAHIIIKDENKQIIKQTRLPLGESSGLNAEWLACKAAIREAGALNRGAVKLYSDCSVVAQLAKLEPEHKLPECGKLPTGWGKLPQYESQELYHFTDAVSMLWTLFKGQWEAYQAEQERILKGEKAA